jgi:hypothetical protein
MSPPLPIPHNLALRACVWAAEQYAFACTITWDGAPAYPHDVRWQTGAVYHSTVAARAGEATIYLPPDTEARIIVRALWPDGASAPSPVLTVRTPDVVEITTFGDRAPRYVPVGPDSRRTQP